LELAALYMPAAQHWPEEQSEEHLAAPRKLFFIMQDTLLPLQEQVGRGAGDDEALQRAGSPQLPALPSWVVLMHHVALLHATHVWAVVAPSAGEEVPAGHSKQEDTPAQAGSV
jgi:hypothetical protein